MNRMKSALWVTMIACGSTTYAATGPSHVFRCTDANGHVVFSDTSCGSTSEKVEVVQSSGGLSPVGSGLTPEERSALSAIEARDAQIAAQRAQGGGGTSAPSAPAPAASPSPPMPHGY